MSSEYIVATITGVLATVVGFFLFAVYDQLTHRKTEKSVRTKMIELLRNELNDNLKIAQKNLLLFQQGIQLSSQRQQTVVSPVFYYDSSWRIAQANGLCSFIGSETYNLLAETYVDFTYSNAQVNTREFFRISNIPLNNPPNSYYSQILLSLDQNLEIKCNGNIEKINQSLKAVEELLKKSRLRFFTGQRKQVTAVNSESPFLQKS